MDRPCQFGMPKPRSLMGRVPAIRGYLSGSKPRMRSFDALWWISWSRFKHCAMVPVLAAICPVFDDDALAETRPHDAGPDRMESFGKDSWSIIGMPVFVPSRRNFLVSGQLLRA